jgi:hypothetical protein
MQPDNAATGHERASKWGEGLGHDPALAMKAELGSGLSVHGSKQGLLLRAMKAIGSANAIWSQNPANLLTHDGMARQKLRVRRWGQVGGEERACMHALGCSGCKYEHQVTMATLRNQYLNGAE